MESLRDVKRKMERELAKGKITPLQLEKMEIFENDYKEISTYDRLSKAQKKLDKAEAVFDKRKYQFDTKKAYEKWLKDNPGVQEKSVSNTMKKQMQKARIKRQYQKAARAAKTAEKTAEATIEAAKTSTLVAHKMKWLQVSIYSTGKIYGIYKI